MLEKTTYMNMLYDFYHSLLTDRQQEYMELYYREDYSLGEISENTHVSRQAVYDTIKRTEQSLKMYETKLGLYEKYKNRMELLQTVEEKLHQKNYDEVVKGIQTLQKMD